METIGDLFDKLSIARIRLSKLKEGHYVYSKIIEVEGQIEVLEGQITDFINSSLESGEVLVAPKTKIYKGEKPAGNLPTSLGSAISKIFNANLTLWNLEDRRRDKTIPDDERLKTCDQVSEWNRRRNDCMDTIDNLFSELIQPKDRE